MQQTTIIMINRFPDQIKGTAYSLIRSMIPIVFDNVNHASAQRVQLIFTFAATLN